MSEGPKHVWNHATVYNALVDRGDEETPTENNRYVHLYPQKVNCAILYAPGGTFDICPLHLHPGRPEWLPEEYRKIMPTIKNAWLGRKSKSQRDQSFIHCEVDDWDQFADRLGLGQFPKS